MSLSATASDLRRAGIPSFKGATRQASTPFSAFSQGTPGETRVNASQMAAINRLYNTSPSIQAARAILVGQLLSSGLTLTRSGEAVKLTPTFSKHLEQRWMPFARAIVDQILMFGFVVVSVEEDDPPPFAKLSKALKPSGGAPPAKRQRAGVSGTGGANTIGDPQTKLSQDAAEVVTRAPAPVNENAPNLVPIVPVLGSYEIAMTPAGRAGYKRTARIFTTAPAHAYELDEYAAIFFRSMPDDQGNIVSSISSCFEFASFTNSLRELALSAEVVRATPTLVTQSAPRGHLSSQGGIDPSNLFFDSESRAIQQQSSDAEASDRTSQLALTAKLASELNRLRTTNIDQHTGQQVSTSNLPPEIPPRLFALPDKQTLVPNALQPQARTDLEALLRMSNEAIACAMGVPASVIFEGARSRTAQQTTLPLFDPKLLCSRRQV